MAVRAAMNRRNATNVSWKVLAVLSGLTQTVVAWVTVVHVFLIQTAWHKRENLMWTFREATVVDKTTSEAPGEIRCVEIDVQE